MVALQNPKQFSGTIVIYFVIYFRERRQIRNVGRGRGKRSKNETNVHRDVIESTARAVISLALIILVSFLPSNVLSSRVQFFNP